ncbi:MAG: hypothetical protein JJU02_14350 [Cryomorphaceae bacterium]|nr:hypothetical protein [Cryomorphaceae bacterium]
MRILKSIDKEDFGRKGLFGADSGMVTSLSGETYPYIICYGQKNIWYN